MLVIGAIALDSLGRRGEETGEPREYKLSVFSSPLTLMIIIRRHHILQAVLAKPKFFKKAFTIFQTLRYLYLVFFSL